MKGRFLVDSKNEPFAECNIFADKSALVLEWLLTVGIDRKLFSLREVAEESSVSVGLVQRIFETLVFQGFLGIEGMRTSKRFTLKKPVHLFKSWIDNYSVVKKCKMRTYHTAFQTKEQMFDALRKSNLSQKTALALHSAAEAHGYKNTNLHTLELYMLDQSIQSKLEDVLQLEPQQRGYEVLLLKPYYKSILQFEQYPKKELRICPILLTFLDLYHFPLRGLEQAEFMAERIPKIQRLMK